MVKKLGFSLIELVVVMGLLSLLMLAISSTMLMSIVSSNRIRTTTKVKQAGNYAITQMQGTIRNAKSISSCIPGSSDASITLVNPDGDQTQFILENSQVASNSGSYLTPDNLEASLFSVTCEPSATDPTLIKISFSLKSKLATERQTGNPTLHFETSVNLRNE